MAIIGEVGLTGEVRNVAMAEKRIIEAEKYKIKIIPVKNVIQAISVITK